MSKHTPWPWDIERRRNSITAIGPCVADEYSGSAWLDVSEANARLIAAAPELLEALGQAADSIEKLAFDMPPPNPYTPQFVMLAIHLRAAIAKATGEQQ